MTAITGANFIGFAESKTGEKSFQAFSPENNSFLPESFYIATESELESALTLAQKAFEPYQQITYARRADFLDEIAEQIVALGDVLVERCTAETGLPEARILGERNRTCDQLKQFSKLLRKGWWLDIRIDTADKDRSPVPKPDIRRMLIPIGPVAVFGASNFPLAFSTAGGDTASALAAGCPVVLKVHSSHPGTSALVSLAILKAAQNTNMPEGVFSSLHLSHQDVIKFVKHPVIKAVGFTGSRQVGMQLFEAAVSRPDPIPVYAEMSAVNPVILLENATRKDYEKIAKGLAASVTLGAGQFCTNPGLILMVENEFSSLFLEVFGKEIQSAIPATMLNRNIHKAYDKAILNLKSTDNVNLLGESIQVEETKKYQAIPSAFIVKGSQFLTDKKLSEEVFGPQTLLVLCQHYNELLEILRALKGQLTATVHAHEDDREEAQEVINIVTGKAGRILYGGFPTGVEVCHAMQHGGPFPSTTDSRSTSVGTAAINRFVRPVAYQNFPEGLLPDALKDENPLQLLRLVNGVWTEKSI